MVDRVESFLDVGLDKVQLGPASPLTSTSRAAELIQRTYNSPYICLMFSLKVFIRP